MAERTIVGEFELTQRKGRRFFYAREVGTNRYRSLGTGDRSEAEARLRASLSDLGAIRTERTAETVTVKEIVEEYYADKIAANGGHYTPSDKSERKMIIASFGALFVAELRREDILGWIEDRMATRGVTRHSAERPMKALGAAINYARAFERRDGSEKTPLEIVFQFPKLRATAAVRERFLSGEEISALLVAVSQLQQRADEVLLWTRLAIATGGRVAAILDLTWSRIHFDTKLIDLNDPTLARRHKSRAVVRMPDAIVGTLLAARERSTGERVFSMSYEVLMKHFRKAAKAAGLWSEDRQKNVTPHVLRHTTATQLAKSGATIEAISAILGHADVRITRKVYAKYSPTFMEQESAVLGDLLTPKLRAVGGEGK